MNLRLAAIAGLVLSSTLLRAEDQAPRLPYGTRTRPYSGWTGTVRGDIRTVGMSGATIGLADTFIAASENPAGLGMTLNTGDINVAANRVRDAHIQDFESPVFTNNGGACMSAYPWGISAGYISAYREDALYRTQVAPTNPAYLHVTTREVRLAFARAFLDNLFSLGTSINVGQAERGIQFSGDGTFNDQHHSLALGGTLGAMIQLPRRFLLGLSYTLPMHYPVRVLSTDLLEEKDPMHANDTPALPGFFQPVEVPARGGVGVGWIPNRFFRMDFTIVVVGENLDAALLRDEEIYSGYRTTLSPRFGAAYVLVDRKNLSATAFSGTYYEMARVSGTDSRIHLTAGLEAKPWVFSLGWGIDLARDYRNSLASVGVDVFKVMEKLDIIPAPHRPSYAGFLPAPAFESDSGLARPLVKDWKPEGPDIDPIAVGLDIPKNVLWKLYNAPNDLRQLGRDIIDTVTPGAPSLPEPMPVPTSR